MQFVSQHRQTVGSQPEDAYSVNLSDGEADAALPRDAHQPEVVASDDEGTSAGALSHSPANTAEDDQAPGHKLVISTAGLSSVTEREAAAVAAALPAFRLSDAVIAEPAELLQPQLPGISAHPAAVLVPVSSISVAGKLPADLRSKVLQRLLSSQKLLLLSLHRRPQLQWPAVSAHPAAELAPAVSPVPAGSLPT